MSDEFKPGYHMRPITPQGVYGQKSKVLEEMDEATEALEQRNTIMFLVECSDILLAFCAYASSTGLGELSSLKNAKELCGMSRERANNIGVGSTSCLLHHLEAFENAQNPLEQLRDAADFLRVLERFTAAKSDTRISIRDIVAMAIATQRAFDSGQRKAKS